MQWILQLRSSTMSRHIASRHHRLTVVLSELTGNTSKSTSANRDFAWRMTVHMLACCGHLFGIEMLLETCICNASAQMQACPAQMRLGWTL